MEWTGGCLCGAVRYRAKTDPFWTGHCHCKMCQHWTGTAAFTGACFAPGQLEWTHGKPSYFQSSKNVQLSFCRTCGSSLGFHRDEHHDGVTAGPLAGLRRNRQVDSARLALRRSELARGLCR